MTPIQNLLLVGAAVSGLALLAAAPVSARTICREDGRCYNTSGLPDQPPNHRYAYAGDPDRYQRHRHFYHHDEER
jgi:hypothetical protein